MHTKFIDHHVTMPPILYGTAWKKDQTARWVELAISQGFRGIDTACQPKHYHEAGVGLGLAACLARGLKRSDIYLQTKYTPLSGHDPLQIPYHQEASLAEQVAQSCQISLHNLQTEYLDCLLLHSPLPEWQLAEVWHSMEQLYNSGLVRQLGISNCYDLAQFIRLYETAEIKPAVIQNRFYASSHYDKDIRKFCVEKQIAYQSFWTLTANPHILNHKVILGLATKYQRTAAQIFFRYLQQVDIIPLTGTTSLQHMQEDLACNEFALLPVERTEIASLLS